MSESEYHLKVNHRLSEEEKENLQREHWPKIVQLCKRYLKNIDIGKGFPLKLEFPEALRGGWLLDKSEDKPPYTDVISGVGYAFGIILEQKLGMEWCIINDNWGESISLVHEDPTGDREYKIVSVSPFNYVSKRENTQNVEVFMDCYREFKEMINR